MAIKASLALLIVSALATATARAQADMAVDAAPGVAHLSRPAVLYASNCAGCHGHSGRSVSEMPTLVDRIGYFVRVPDGRAYLAQVPNVAMSALGDGELAILLNWLLRTYSAGQLPADFRDYTAAEVGGYRQQSIIPWQRRRELIAELVLAGQLPSATVLD